MVGELSPPFAPVVFFASALKMVDPDDILYTHGSWVKDPVLLGVMDAICLQFKNISNKAIHFADIVLRAIDKDGLVKESATPYQRSVIELANKMVAQANVGIKSRAPAKHAKAMAKAKAEGKKIPKKPKPKLLKIFGAEKKPLRAKATQILEVTLLGAMVRASPDADGFCVYEALPGAVASEAVQRVSTDFRSWLAGAKAHKANEHKFTGRPERPRCHGKDERIQVIFPASNAFQFDKGVPHPTKPFRFNAFEGRALHRDYAKRKGVVSEAELAAFCAIDLDKEWSAHKTLNGLPADTRLSEVRLRPERDGRVELVFVSKIHCPLREGSFAKKIHGQVALNPKMERASDAEVEEEIARIVSELAADELPLMAGQDPGVNNIVSLAMNDGKPVVVVSGRRFDEKIARFEAKMDAIKSELTSPEVRELMRRREKAQRIRQEGERIDRELAATLKAIQAKAPRIKKTDRPAKGAPESEVIRKHKEAMALARAEHAAARERLASSQNWETDGGLAQEDLSLSPEELATLKKGLSAIYSDPRLIGLKTRRKQWADNHHHTLTSGVIEILKERKIELLVLAHNKGWKQEPKMGRKQNRRLHRFAHADLFHMFHYKGRADSILVIETEESDTSKKSFAANEAMRAHPEALRRAGKAPAAAVSSQSENKEKTLKTALASAQKTAISPMTLASLLKASKPQQPTTEGCPPAKTGEMESKGKTTAKGLGARGQGPKRHVYATPTAAQGWRRIHSDGNGAYNALRKACPAFQWSAELNPRHELFWVSPWKGLSRMRLKKQAPV